MKIKISIFCLICIASQVVVALSACSADQRVDTYIPPNSIKTPQPTSTETIIPTSSKKQSATLALTSAHQPTATRTPDLSKIKLLLTKTPEVENLIPNYKPGAWTVYVVSVAGIRLPSAPYYRFFHFEDMEEDENGVYWMGTEHGLVRFDGQEWELIAAELQFSGWSHVEIGDDGSVWFNLSDGVYQYLNGKVNLRYGKLDGQRLRWMEISPSGDVWVSCSSFTTDDVLLSYDGYVWNPLTVASSLPVDTISYLVFDSKGRPYVWWLRTQENCGSGLAYYEEGEWIIFDQKEQYGNSDPLCFYDDIVPLVVDAQDHIWFYMRGQGLYEFYDDQFYRRAQPIWDYLGYYDPGPMVIDRNGVLWLRELGLGAYLAKYVPGTDGLQSIDGSSEFYIFSSDPDEAPLSRYQAENILPFTDAYSLFVDSANRLWISTSSGIYVFDLNY